MCLHNLSVDFHICRPEFDINIYLVLLKDSVQGKHYLLHSICNELRVIWPIPHEILSVITRSTIIT